MRNFVPDLPLGKLSGSNSPLPTTRGQKWSNAQAIPGGGGGGGGMSKFRTDQRIIITHPTLGSKKKKKQTCSHFLQLLFYLADALTIKPGKKI